MDQNTLAIGIFVVIFGVILYFGLRTKPGSTAPAIKPAKPVPPPLPKVIATLPPLKKETEAPVGTIKEEFSQPAELHAASSEAVSSVAAAHVEAAKAVLATAVVHLVHSDHPADDHAEAAKELLNSAVEHLDHAAVQADSAEGHAEIAKAGGFEVPAHGPFSGHADSHPAGQHEQGDHEQHSQGEHHHDA